MKGGAPPFSMSAGYLREFSIGGTKISLSINKTLELVNSNLIAAYCQVEPTFHKVALILKRWNKKVKERNKIDSKSGLNSFTICLMLLYYM